MFYIVFVFDDASTEVVQVEEIALTSSWGYLTDESLKDSVMEVLVFEGKYHKMIGVDW